MIPVRIPICAVFCLCQHALAGTISYVVDHPLARRGPSDTGIYTYFLEGFDLKMDQEIDILFLPDQFGALLDGVAGDGFGLILFQPNNPPGTPGDYSAIALLDSPPLTGLFSVTFRFLGAGTPGSQPYSINQYDQNGNFIGQIDSGFTVTAPDTSPTPEPGNLAVVALLLAAGGVWQTRRHRLKKSI